MINYLVGDATSPIGDGNKIIVHCCNNIGAWGRGFVKALSDRFPISEKMYREWFVLSKNYENLFDTYIKKYGSNKYKLLFPDFKLGEVQFVNVENDICVANLIGQEGLIGDKHKPPIRYDAIEEGFIKVLNFSEKLENVSIHMPYIGCGLAGGSFEEIEKIIKKIFYNKINVNVYSFQDKSSEWFVPVKK